jgi:hypothetical protein
MVTSERWFLRKPPYIVRRDKYYDLNRKRISKKDRRVRRFDYEKLNEELLEIYNVKIIFYTKIKYNKFYFEIKCRNMVKYYDEDEIFDFHSGTIGIKRIGSNKIALLDYERDHSTRGNVSEFLQSFYLDYSLTFFFDISEAPIQIFYLNYRPVDDYFVRGLVDHLEYIYYDFAGKRRVRGKQMVR